MMTVHLPPDLAEEFHADSTLHLPVEALTQLMGALNDRYPGMAGWLTEADGHVREHLSVFVDGRRLRPREDLSIPFATVKEVWILRATSGG